MTRIVLLLAAVFTASIGGCGSAPGTTMSAPTSMTRASLAPTGMLRVAVFALLREGKVDAIAQNRFLLLGLAEQLPGSRVLEDRFSAAEMTIVLPKGRAAALEYVGVFVEEAKRSGSVGRAIEAAGLRGVRVALPGA